MHSGQARRATLLATLLIAGDDYSTKDGTFNSGDYRHLEEVEKLMRVGKPAKPDSVGLGLSVARQLARLMEGDLVYRRSNGWTGFELTLPLQTEAALVN